MGVWMGEREGALGLWATEMNGKLDAQSLHETSHGPHLIGALDSGKRSSWQDNQCGME